MLYIIKYFQELLKALGLERTKGQPKQQAESRGRNTMKEICYYNIFVLLYQTYLTQIHFATCLLFVVTRYQFRINENLWQNIVLSVCYFAMSFYCMSILYCITLTAEEAYDSLQSLNTPLENMLVIEDDLKRKMTLNGRRP